ncbi:hypothetical protein VTL71DRAFT_348 [Oculimacula yallundae]|uniref:Uncharacterized protein n=1 Tax=Oculimacula yallundae TaxID=86028 RepID=A0ABR4CZY7_9HELO
MDTSTAVYGRRALSGFEVRLARPRHIYPRKAERADNCCLVTYYARCGHVTDLLDFATFMYPLSVSHRPVN